LLLALLFGGVCCCRADAATEAADTNAFPSPVEVFQGRAFENETARDVFFLRAIHDRYAAHWPELLAANISVNEYVFSPEKLLRFINELGAAMAGRDDPGAITNLAAIPGSVAYYANTNTYHPEILRAAAQALIGFGPNGRKALAAAFSVEHYRQDAASLEELAQVIGAEHRDDPVLAGALAATAFACSTTNGGSFPRCTATAVQNLLLLPSGAAAVQSHLQPNEVFADPGRFQAVVDGIAAARNSELATNLAALQTDVQAKLTTLTNYPGAYRDDLQELQVRLERAVRGLSSATPAGK
jgi:hypothetical protein